MGVSRINIGQDMWLGAFEESALDKEIGQLWIHGMMFGSSARADFSVEMA